MTHQQVLTRAINKVTANGWKDETVFSWIREDHKAIVDWLLIRNQYCVLIFNHDFAKALWGEQEFTGLDVLLNDDIFTGVKRDHYWQFHLQQMVIADDPIKYLGENI